MIKEALGPRRWCLPVRMALAGAWVGLVVGLLEATLFYSIPRAAGLLHPDVRYVIWFLALCWVLSWVRWARSWVFPTRHEWPSLPPLAWDSWALISSGSWTGFALEPA